MKTTTKNRNYYFDILCTPCYLLRNKLQDDYKHYAKFGINTLDILSMFADHLTAYNEIAIIHVFWRMRDFRPSI